PSTGAPIDAFPSEQRLWVFDQAARTITTFIVPGVVAAAFYEDEFRAYAVGKGDINSGSISGHVPNEGNLAVFSPVLTLVKQTVPITGNNVFKDVTSLASGPFVYLANSGGLQVIATCNNAQQGVTPPTNSSTIQFVGGSKNSNTIIAMDATGLDVETVTTSAPAAPFAITPANCQENVSYSNQFFDFGLGAITARQLLVGSNGQHVVVLPAGINKILATVPVVGGTTSSIVLPAGATEALSGSMTPDSNTMWTGVAGTNSVDRINLLANTDDIQLPMTFKKSDGSAAPPNIIAIKPK
ncbi:MAG TPA: hypothetical protein VH724_03175, partial [Candidatus Angelobacter sp.]|nr:hypothetical protein [Candidatus Angelobacter sp.]